MPRAPLTEEQKQVLRDRLAAARATKAAKPKVPKVVQPPADPIVAQLYSPWTEDAWKSGRIEDCKRRLALLKEDFERGARIVGQRGDVNDPHSYTCFVCGNPVSEVAPSGRGPGWVWKHDYLNPKTGLYESVVICNQTCHTIYSNDTRLQMRLKDLITGVAADKQAPVEEPVTQ